MGVLVSDLYHHLCVPSEGVVLKGTVLVLHGMMEHSGRYEDFAYYLSRSGFVVLLYDHPGHGRTAPDWACMGFFRENEPAQFLIDAARCMSDYLLELYPQLPQFLLGHSMGSFVGRCLLQELPVRFAGVVLIGTGEVQPGIGLSLCLFGVLNKLAPHARSIFLNRLFNTVQNRHFRFEDTADEKSWLSVNIQNRRSFVEDAYCGVDFTNNGYWGLLTLVSRAASSGWAVGIDRDLSLLFVNGSDDVVGGFSKGVSAIVNRLRKDGFGNVDQKLYAKMRHEILNEDIRDVVYRDIVSWMEKCLR